MSRHVESQIQRNCVTWFRLQFPEYAKLLFAIPNGGARGKAEAAIMKAEGVVAGVSDLIFLHRSGSYSALCIEMKTDRTGSRQSDNQKAWQVEVEKAGNKYIICRNFDEFRQGIKNYLYLQDKNQMK